MQENDVRDTAEGNIAEHTARRGVNREQHAGIAGTQQPARGRIELQPVRPCRRNPVLLRDLGRVTGIDGDDPRRRHDIDEERLARGVVNRPARATGDRDLGDPLPAHDINDRYRIRIRDRGVADIRGDQDAARGIESESVRFHADGNLESIPLGTWREHRDGVLAAIGRKDEPARLGHQRTCHRRESGDRFDVSIARAVDHVDRIVAGMRDVEPIRGRMDVGVIEPTFGSIGRELDVTE